MAQGTAAAVLASAYLSHQNDGSASPFAIDLSSERVRTARLLIDGVRQGQPLAALLGYRLERALHDRGLDPYIATFRRLAPLVSTPSVPTTPTEAIVASNVVHGLDILSQWKNKDPRFEALRTSLNIPDFIAIDAEFKALDDQRDAVGDLLIAESMFQATRGNLERAGVTLDSVVRGEMLPDPEVIDTPRTGLGMHHRLMALFRGATVAAPNWRGQLRSIAEPHLTLFASQILGNPIQVRCRATYLHPTTGATLSTREIRLVDLLLSPLDVIYIAPGELEQRFILACRRTHPANIPADANVRLDFSRAPTWASSIFSVDEFLEAVSALRRLITSGRPLNADDLSLPELGSAPGVDQAELKGRTDLVLQRFWVARDFRCSGTSVV